MTTMCEESFNDWQPSVELADQTRLASNLESGAILFFPHLSFHFEPDELPLLDLAPTKAKNISFQRDTERLKGIECDEQQQLALKAMMSRYVMHAKSLVSSLFPEYESAMQTGLTSLRTVEAEGRKSDSFRKDDTRLHIDAFPSRPTHGNRLLRVFCNINQTDKARVWKAGEPFENVAKTFLPNAAKYSSLFSALRNMLGLTKTFQTHYDHLMLQLHHLMKADAAYQENVSQSVCEFPPGSTWIVFSDQVSHAVLSGQHMMEQTFYLPVEAMYEPERSPLKVLERLTAQALI